MLDSIWSWEAWQITEEKKYSQWQLIEKERQSIKEKKKKKGYVFQGS